MIAICLATDTLVASTATTMLFAKPNDTVY